MNPTLNLCQGSRYQSSGKSTFSLLFLIRVSGKKSFIYITEKFKRRVLLDVHSVVEIVREVKYKVRRRETRRGWIEQKKQCIGSTSSAVLTQENYFPSLTEYEHKHTRMYVCMHTYIESGKRRPFMESTTTCLDD